MALQKFFKILFFIGVALSMQSCFLYKDVTYKGLVGFEVKELSFSGVKIGVALEVENPNFYKITAKGGELAVKANSLNFGSFKLTNEVVLPKKKTGTVALEIESKFKDLVSGGIMSAFALFKTGGKINVNIDGYVIAKALGISKKVKIQSTESVSL